MKRESILGVMCACVLTASAQTTTTGRPGLVVLPATATRSLTVDMAKFKDAGFNRVLDGLPQHVESAVASSRKFTILERGENLGAILDDPAKLGSELKLRPNDYAMTITLNNFVDVTDKLDTMTRRRIQISGQVKIIGGETAEVLDISDIQTEVNSLVQSQGAATTRLDARLDALMTEAARDFTDKSVEQLLAVTFPAKVIDVDGSTLTVNRGEGFFKVGDTVTLFGVNKEIIDPDTGEKIKIKGKKFGTARVTDVEANVSQMEVEGGVAVSNGANVRK